MKVYTLGTGAPLSYDRATMGLLLEQDERPPLLIDTCSGSEIVRRLSALGKTIEHHNNVILTHRHGDHIGGVGMLALAAQPLHLYGPQDALDAAKAFIELTFGDLPDLVLAHTTFHPVQPDTAYDIAGFSVSFFEVEHRVPTYAVRVEHGGTIFAYSADSVPCEGVVRCATDADLFLCDAVCAASDHPEQVEMLKKLAHPTARDAAEMAQTAHAKQLGLVHVSRFGTPEKMLAEAQNAFDGPVTLPDDNHCYDI